MISTERFKKEAWWNGDKSVILPIVIIDIAAVGIMLYVLSHYRRHNVT